MRGMRETMTATWFAVATVGLATSMLLATSAGPALPQEIRPTLDKIKETGAIQLGYRETSRPFSFLGNDGQPAGYSVDLCLNVASALRQSLKLTDLKVTWVPVTFDADLNLDFAKVSVSANGTYVVVTGQMAAALLLDSTGMFGVHQTSLTIVRVLGALLIILGVILIQIK